MLDISYVQSFFWTIRGTLTASFERQLAGECLANIRANSFNSFLGKYHERYTKFQLYKNLSLFYEEHLTYYWILVSLSYKPKFLNWTFSWSTDLFTLYLLIFCASWSSSSTSTLFYKTNKILMKLSVFFLFFEGLQSQNLIIMFLFSMKYLYLLTTKTTPGVNNSL